MNLRPRKAKKSKPVYKQRIKKNRAKTNEPKPAVQPQRSIPNLKPEGPVQDLIPSSPAPQPSKQYYLPSTLSNYGPRKANTIIPPTLIINQSMPGCPRHWRPTTTPPSSPSSPTPSSLSVSVKKPKPERVSTERATNPPVKKENPTAVKKTIPLTASTVRTPRAADHPVKKSNHLKVWKTIKKPETTRNQIIPPSGCTNILRRSSSYNSLLTAGSNLIDGAPLAPSRKERCDLTFDPPEPSSNPSGFHRGSPVLPTEIQEEASIPATTAPPSRLASLRPAPNYLRRRKKFSVKVPPPNKPTVRGLNLRARPPRKSPPSQKRTPKAKKIQDNIPKAEKIQAKTTKKIPLPPKDTAESGNLQAETPTKADPAKNGTSIMAKSKAIKTAAAELIYLDGTAPDVPLVAMSLLPFNLQVTEVKKEKEMQVMKTAIKTDAPKCRCQSAPSMKKVGPIRPVRTSDMPEVPIPKVLVFFKNDKVLSPAEIFKRKPRVL